MRLTAFIVLVVLSLGVVGYAVFAYSMLPLGATVHPEMRQSFVSYAPAAMYAHIFGSALALALGPFQFLTRLRTRHPNLHRLSGRLYLGAGVLIGGLSGFVVAFDAFGGLIARTGFACLAIAWLFSGFKAYQAIRSGDVRLHRQWMVRNFSLTFAAVTLRILLGSLVGSGVPFEIAYPTVSWLCWIPNLILAELVFNRHEGKQSKLSA